MTLSITRSVAAAALGAVLLAAPACTDLTELPQSAITPENFYRNRDEVLAGLAAAYAQLQNTNSSYYNLVQVTADENIVPTRGSDWYDNGRWLELDRQGYSPGSAATLEDINGAWNDLFQGIARSNVVLQAIENVNFAGKDTVTAELRALRGFYYYLMQDLFGGVPIVTTTAIEPRARATRAEVFAFIESELKAVRLTLPKTWPANYHGRMTRGAVDAILASLYLNSEVYSGSVDANGLVKGTARWQLASDFADSVINSGVYSMATRSGWRGIFAADNFNSMENIFVIKFLNTDGLGMTIQMRGLHYTQFSPSPWNGFATIADVYNQFDAADPRRQESFLEGDQVNLETGLPVNDRQGNRLKFTVTIADPTQATEGEGVRIHKFPIDPAHAAQNNGNDFPYFRLAEMYLIKAEALNELGQTATAIGIVNTQIRARQNLAPLSTGLTQAQARDAIFQERLFEFVGEAKRRSDLVRAGKFTDAWLYKPAAPKYKIVFPIPSSQIVTNPQLTQNPGY
jgi:hypothetical protein